MERVSVPLGGRAYSIDIGESLLGQIKAYIQNRTAYLITDNRVLQLYQQEIENFHIPYFVIEQGESSKNLSMMQLILKDMLRCNLHRDAIVIAFGGGVVGDMAGFAASIYMRGIDFVQVPTTLLAQVDSSVGGKTGVDLENTKNIVGSFYQPKHVWIDTLFLNTLPKEQILSGMGECIKTAFLCKEVYQLVFEGKSPIHYLPIIAACVRLKAAIVVKDEQELNERKILNFGHTFGHALESLHFGTATHGEFVLQGIYHEFQLSRALGIVDEAYFHQAMDYLKPYLTNQNLALPVDALLPLLIQDKKNNDKGICFVLPSTKCKTTIRYMLANDLNNIFRSGSPC